MNKTEALCLLRAQLEPWRGCSYSELPNEIDCSHRFEVNGSNDAWYQGHVRVYWDAEPHGAVRVIGSIDDGGWRAFAPLTDSFIVASDGSFVGEQARPTGPLHLTAPPRLRTFLALSVSSLTRAAGERPAVKPPDTLMVHNRYLPLWLHRVCNGVFGAVLLIGIGSLSFGEPAETWRHIVSRCLIGASIPVGTILAVVAHRFSIVQGVAGGDGYNDLHVSDDKKPRA